MNLLIENGMVAEIPSGSNFSYIAYMLKDPASLLSTEYKVLQSQTSSVFIKCMKLLYNGNVALYYLVNEGCKPLSSMLSSLDPDRFVMIVGNLLAGIIDVKNNGFLACSNIDISLDHICVDQNTYKVSLVYLPLSKHAYSDDAAFEYSLRTSLIRTISETPSLFSSRTSQLIADLQNGTLSLEALHAKLGGVPRQSFGAGAAPAGPANTGSSFVGTAGMRLVSMETGVELLITKPEFSIGKLDTNDGVVTFNKLISRNHCKVFCRGQQYAVMDLNSANGTYINGARLVPDQPKPLKHGDVLRLANSNFQVLIG